MELTQDVSILLRVAAAMLFGGVLGVEREMGKHAAGLRTHMLIAGAAALIVGLGDSVAEHFQQERYRDLLQARGDTYSGLAAIEVDAAAGDPDEVADTIVTALAELLVPERNS